VEIFFISLVAYWVCNVCLCLEKYNEEYKLN